MANNDDMREQFKGLETKFDGLETKFTGLEQKFTGLEEKFDGLEKKIDRLPTADDFSKLTDKVTMLLGDAKDNVQKAAEGYGATLDGLERDLGEFRTEWRTKAEDTDRILANHAHGIVTLERVAEASRD